MRGLTTPINGSQPQDYPRRRASSRVHCIGWFAATWTAYHFSSGDNSRTFHHLEAGSDHKGIVTNIRLVDESNRRARDNTRLHGTIRAIDELDAQIFPTAPADTKMRAVMCLAVRRETDRNSSPAFLRWQKLDFDFCDFRHPILLANDSGNRAAAKKL